MYVILSCDLSVLRDPRANTFYFKTTPPIHSTQTSVFFFFLFELQTSTTIQRMCEKVSDREKVRILGGRVPAYIQCALQGSHYPGCIMHCCLTAWATKWLPTRTIRRLLDLKISVFCLYKINSNINSQVTHIQFLNGAMFLEQKKMLWIISVTIRTAG